MGNYRYFNDVEVANLDKELVAMLDRARHIAGIPFEITSGYRIGDANGVDNGIKNSAHMNHKAVDLRCHDSVTRFKIIKSLIEVGFRRIGFDALHVHCDNDETKPQDVFWLE